MNAELSLDDAEFSRLVDAAAEFPERSEDAVNSALHGEAGQLIYERVNPLIHPSGRTFAGHRASARASDWPRFDTEENLSVTVGAKRRFRYLYFPDDGENTRRHAGNQRFMERGAQLAAPGIVDRCIAEITKDWS